MCEENFEIKNNKAVEAGVNVFHRKEEELKKEIEIVKNQHASDSAILLLLVIQELEKVKQELAASNDAKNMFFSQAKNASLMFSIHTEKVDIYFIKLIRLKAMLDSTRENETISNKEFCERSVYDNLLGSLCGFIEGFDGDGSCPGAFISPASEDEVLSRVRSSDGEESANVHLAFDFCRYPLGVKDFLSVSIVCKSL